MSAASSTVQAAPAPRQAGFAAFALILAALAVLTVVAYSQLSTASQAVAPASGTAPVQHDRGWSSAEASVGGAWVTDSNSAANDAARHPNLRSVTMTPQGIRITGSRGGAILYNGIPYTQPASDGAGGSTRLQLAQ